MANVSLKLKLKFYVNLFQYYQFLLNTVFPINMLKYLKFPKYIEIKGKSEDIYTIIFNFVIMYLRSASWITILTCFKFADKKTCFKF